MRTSADGGNDVRHRAVGLVVLADCEQRMRREQEQCGWPLDSVVALAAMKALALPFELHPAWQDDWHP
ncbi:hypothetical protein ACWCQ1_48315 [Streptomyces sp. NPDC002144]